MTFHLEKVQLNHRIIHVGRNLRRSLALTPAFPMFNYPYRKIVFPVLDCNLGCLNFHPLSSWKAVISYLVFHMHHEASDPSPVQLTFSALKFTIFSFHHVPIPVNSSTQIIHCYLFTLRPANTGGCFLSHCLKSSLFAASTSSMWWFSLAVFWALGPETSPVIVLNLVH